jgi:cytoskeletal protein CcmA (bactofilin family)
MKHPTDGRAHRALAALLLGLGGAVALGVYGCTGADFHGSDSDAAAHNDGDSKHSGHDHGDGGDTEIVVGSVHVDAGEHAGDVSTVNGSVHVGDNAVVGKAEVVNGAITIGAHATASGAEAVNGPIKILDGAGISGAVGTVNGPISLADGADVKGRVSNVNGPIKVAAAHVGGDIETVSGDIELGPNGHVDGGILVEHDNSWFKSGDDMPRIVIRPGSVVKGTLHFDRPVVLYVSDRATIGPVQGATPKTFSGDEPPTS